jgi:hypothetical protein
MSPKRQNWRYVLLESGESSRRLAPKPRKLVPMLRVGMPSGTLCVLSGCRHSDAERRSPENSFPCSAWECRPGRSASSQGAGIATRSVEDGIPTETVGTRRSTSACIIFLTSSKGGKDFALAALLKVIACVSRTAQLKSAS